MRIPRSFYSKDQELREYSEYDAFYTHRIIRKRNSFLKIEQRKKMECLLRSNSSLVDTSRSPIYIAMTTRYLEVLRDKKSIFYLEVHSITSIKNINYEMHIEGDQRVIS